MKGFRDYAFDFAEYQKEVHEFQELLTNNAILEERSEIQPFFRRSEHLTAFIASLQPRLSADVIAFEYDLWGKFKCDAVVGDSKKGLYCFIEFEDYKADSIFTKAKSDKGLARPYSARFERGFSQIVDWLCLLDNFANTTEIGRKFHKSNIEYEGILVIGRSQDIDDEQRQRLEWRERKTKVDSKSIRYMTFNDVCEAAVTRLEDSTKVV